jgi:hypothetical protein
MKRFVIALALILDLTVAMACAPMPPVTVTEVNRSQILGKEAVRVGPWPDGSWSIYLAKDAAPGVLEWELGAIWRGKDDDRLPGG